MLWWSSPGSTTNHHPQTDGSSECTNKTVIQCLWFHIERNQKGWAKALPKVWFDIMNTPNTSMGLSPFVLKMGRSPWFIPPLISMTAPESDSIDITSAQAFVTEMEQQMKAARDSLLAAKISQAHAANKNCAADPTFIVGEKVLLATAHQQRDYMQAKDRHVAKFMPCFDGPYEILQVHPESSAYTLQLPPALKAHPTFHILNLRWNIANNNNLFPSCAHHPPQPLVTVDGTTEYFINKMLNKCPCRWGHQFLVWWEGYSLEHDLWLLRSELLDTEALHVVSLPCWYLTQEDSSSEDVICQNGEHQHLGFLDLTQDSDAEDWVEWWWINVSDSELM